MTFSKKLRLSTLLHGRLILNQKVLRPVKHFMSMDTDCFNTFTIYRSVSRSFRNLPVPMTKASFDLIALHFIECHKLHTLL
jgi:hypothetical protein